MANGTGECDNAKMFDVSEPSKSNPIDVFSATILQSTKPKFMIHFCDVGDIDIIDNISSIKVLPDEYRALPKLAIKATLYGIESKYASGWDMDDIIHFGRCVTGKKYQAIVNKITVDETTDDNDVLAIQLIDVSNDFIDVCINDQLVSDGRAVAHYKR